MYPYGLVGNCQISALISGQGSIDWLCLPRPDSEPIFGRLLDKEGGYFSIESSDPIASTTSQYYTENTNILITEIHDSVGNLFRITDYCPRFEQHGRIYRPMALFRIVEPLKGVPSIRVTCCPISGWSKQKVKMIRGNSHIRFDLPNDSLRITTNMPLTYLCEPTSFQLKEKVYFGLSWSFGIEEDLGQFLERALLQTRDYWRTWVKHCSIPVLFQPEVIRSALVLKLHCYEDTGAILAALTTSLPEEIGKNRNWDYRYCWLRDAYFALSAFNNLGHFEEMEGFLKFLLDIAHKQESSRERLAPVYTLSRALPLPETIHENWLGYKGTGPVRSNNLAAEQTQNDVYGEMILTLTPIFFDRRFSHLWVQQHEDLLEHLGGLASKAIAKPDAGLWEIRNGWQEHSFTNFMSWAGLERIERIQRNGYLKDFKLNVTAERVRAEAAVQSAVKDATLRNGPRDPTFDSALSLLPVLRFPNILLCEQTIDALDKNLCVEDTSGAFFYRYIRKDDFGSPQSAFIACSFWMAEAFSRLGQKSRAVQILDGAMKSANNLGLFSEHYNPLTGEQLGNFPQAYSHVGLINAAFAVSPRWSEIL